jgi:hypothetical protein|tara:strand:+ start:1110 stop:1733 length:624 start_codon:yes stop_codon:yes gene_type:complete
MKKKTEKKAEVTAEVTTEETTQSSGKTIMLWDREEAMSEGTVKTRELRDNIEVLQAWDNIDFSELIGTHLWSRKTLGTAKADNQTIVYYDVEVDKTGLIDLLHLVTQQINIIRSRVDSPNIDKLHDGQVLALKLSSISPVYIGRGATSKPAGTPVAQLIKLFRNKKLGFTEETILTQIDATLDLETTSEADRTLLEAYRDELTNESD